VKIKAPDWRLLKWFTMSHCGIAGCASMYAKTVNQSLRVRFGREDVWAVGCAEVAGALLTFGFFGCLCHLIGCRLVSRFSFLGSHCRVRWAFTTSTLQNSNMYTKIIMPTRTRPRPNQPKCYLIMHNGHAGLCIMHYDSISHCPTAGLSKPYALWDLCIMRLCIMTYCTVLSKGFYNNSNDGKEEV
jgi:hypothetical protein